MTNPGTASGERIAIGVDGSHHALDAVKFYLKRLHKPGNHLVLIHSPEPFSNSDFIVAMSTGRHGLGLVGPELWCDALEEERSKVDVMKAEIEKTLPTEVSYTWCVSGGGNSPGQQIVAAAKEENCRMIVVGTRGLGKLRRTFLGSVSDYVIHHSSIPVVVCPSSDHE